MGGGNHDLQLYFPTLLDQNKQGVEENVVNGPSEEASDDVADVLALPRARASF